MYSNVSGLGLGLGLVHCGLGLGLVPNWPLPWPRNATLSGAPVRVTTSCDASDRWDDSSMTMLCAL